MVFVGENWIGKGIQSVNITAFFAYNSKNVINKIEDIFLFEFINLKHLKDSRIKNKQTNK